jgi:hypothetical protein
MDQFNKNVYKKQGLFDEFSSSCLGKLIIMGVIIIGLCVLAIISVPTEEQMFNEAEDNIRECIQDNNEKKGDIVDEIVWNIGRSFSVADSTLDNKETLEAFAKYNTIDVFRHSLYSTARISNSTHPEGVRVAFGIFGFVISTVHYNDLVLDFGPVRGNYDDRLIKTTIVPEEDDNELLDTSRVETYHYEGNQDN